MLRNKARVSKIEKIFTYVVALAAVAIVYNSGIYYSRMNNALREASLNLENHPEYSEALFQYIEAEKQYWDLTKPSFWIPFSPHFFETERPTLDDKLK